MLTTRDIALRAAMITGAIVLGGALLVTCVFFPPAALVTAAVSTKLAGVAAATAAKTAAGAVVAGVKTAGAHIAAGAKAAAPYLPDAALATVTGSVLGGLAHAKYKMSQQEQAREKLSNEFELGELPSDELRGEDKEPNHEHKSLEAQHSEKSSGLAKSISKAADSALGAVSGAVGSATKAASETASSALDSAKSYFNDCPPSKDSMLSSLADTVQQTIETAGEFAAHMDKEMSDLNSSFSFN